MNRWFVFVLISTLLVLPFAGSASAGAHSKMNVSAELVEAGNKIIGADADSNPAAESSAAEKSAAKSSEKQPHCALMASATEKDTLSKNIAMSCCDALSSSVYHSEPHHSEADSTNQCAADACSSDCGHCVSAGHGVSALSNCLMFNCSALFAQAPALVISFYSHLTPEPTPPPIIS
ncbi:hypothetical protein CWE08_06965 [Aliidiomarina iranensis]|uniref:Secreted protein n=1 Tax=Aliidiomarina iranensis TaxID=1434071 RepID=A0A432VW76_9GAMM|nr:hypothetical protein [Aliidiomarina iranensis]RUO20836.1 hypothetical protein CWE08_06965 [Aliidiomarina iranensis]